MVIENLLAIIFVILFNKHNRLFLCIKYIGCHGTSNTLVHLMLNASVL